jgi:hypothetical protein
MERINHKINNVIKNRYGILDYLKEHYNNSIGTDCQYRFYFNSTDGWDFDYILNAFQMLFGAQEESINLAYHTLTTTIGIDPIHVRVIVCAFLLERCDSQLLYYMDDQRKEHPMSSVTVCRRPMYIIEDNFIVKHTINNSIINRRQFVVNLNNTFVFIPIIEYSFTPNSIGIEINKLQFEIGAYGKLRNFEYDNIIHGIALETIMNNIYKLLKQLANEES